MLEFLQQPWPWYVCGLLLGATVPFLLIVGNKPLGVSSSFRDLCATCLPDGINPFRRNKGGDSWNLYFTAGILLGGAGGALLLSGGGSVAIDPETQSALAELGVRRFDGLLPADIFSAENIFSLKGLLFFVAGGFLVGFGTRYAGGCTSGHTITGLSCLHWPSLVATVCFMVGGIAATHLLLPIIFPFL